ncbi:oligogalacturonate lyase family protein [Enterobacter sp.]|uniref:oligogalacturonate lyase family protein n=1 Tax=Enterobacter sp. TaxID=42895 RepID=UPI003A911F21
MAKGMRVKLNYEVSRDPDTGVEVTRLTPPEVTCHRNYFYQKCFFNDGSHLLFAGEFDGHWNYYLLDLKNAEAVQLTEGAGDNTFGGFLSPDDTSFYYVKNDRSLLEVNLKTLVEREVYRVPDEWVGYGTWVANSDCTKLVGIEIAKSDWTPLNDWKIFHDFFHKGPHDLVDARMWLVNEDGSNVRKVKEHAPGESCTHEFWVPNGSALVYVSYLKGQQGRTISRYNPDTGVNEEVMKMPACSHLMSNFDGTMLVGDGSGTPVDVKDTGGYTIDNDPYLYAFDVAKKAYFRIARHDTSWATVANSRQVTHPHPSFTPDDTAVLFSSDKDGKPALYIAKLPEQPELLHA